MEEMCGHCNAPEEEAPTSRIMPECLCKELGILPEGAVVSLTDFAKLMGSHPISVDRAIKRGELPPPTRLMGKRVWTAGCLLKHIEGRLAEESRKRQELVRRVANLRP